MKFEQAKNKIGYPCLYSESPEDATSNLLRLILHKQCGFDEGASEWSHQLKKWLDSNFDLSELNYCGAAFRPEQWREILVGVLRGLERNGE